MIDFEKLNAVAARKKQFRKTELGKLFWAHKSAVINHWRNDMNDRISDKKLRELYSREQETERAFVEKLMELANA